MTKVLITGGSGFIGRNLVEYLGDRYDLSAPAPPSWTCSMSARCAISCVAEASM